MDYRYEVRIVEVVRPESRPNAPTPLVRDVIWWGEATCDEAARAAAWRSWHEKYGADEAPAQAKVDVLRHSD